jgi:hypothetical protein
VEVAVAGGHNILILWTVNLPLIICWYFKGFKNLKNLKNTYIRGVI